MNNLGQISAGSRCFFHTKCPDKLGGPQSSPTDQVYRSARYLAGEIFKR